MKTQSKSNDWTVNRQCNGVIAHEDPPTELRARRLWNQLVNDMGREIQCRVTCQSAEQIKELPDFDRAYQTDIVIISVHDLARFCFGTAGWLTDWLNAKSCLPRALFILHDGEQDGQVVGFLRTISESAGVTLFSCGRETGDASAVSDPRHDCRPAEDLAPVL